MPDRLDLIVHGARNVPLLAIADGQFVDADSHATAREEIDATGLIALPGVVDAHVHFNEPGRTEWEGWATGSRAAAAGGTTTVFDMPLNSTPPVVTADAFEAKRRAAEAQSICDFALWGGLVPGHLDDMPAVAACGAIGFKAFMADSGVDDFPKVDLVTLRDGMRRAAALRLPVAVHAEFDRGASTAAPVSAALEADVRRGTTLEDFLAARPITSECDAIRAAVDLAGDTGCALHIVHVSSARGLAIAADARARGVDVTAETCPHYLVLTQDDMARLGPVAKCAPPLRDDAERRSLVARVHAGDIDTIGSDHSPSPWSLKAHDDYFRVWGGIAGVQHLLPLLLDAGFDAPLIARLTAEHVARRFRLPSKGSLTPGCDADLTLVEIGGSHEVTADALLSRHRLSPYVGRRLGARVRLTIVRGRIVYRDGRVLADRGGRLLTPV